MTVSQLQAQRADVEHKLRRYWTLTTREVDALEDQLRAIDRQVEDARAAAESLKALLMQPDYHRSFVKDLAEDVVADHLAYGLTPGFVPRGSEASRGTSLTFGPPVTTEETYAVRKHEVAHCVDPLAESRQHWYLEEKGYLSSPLAESAAWMWAIEHCYRGFWTLAMQLELHRCLGTYKRSCTPAEVDVLECVVGAGLACVRPAPDTPEGRKDRVRELKRDAALRQRYQRAGILVPAAAGLSAAGRKAIAEARACITGASRTSEIVTSSVFATPQAPTEWRPSRAFRERELRLRLRVHGIRETTY